MLIFHLVFNDNGLSETHCWFLGISHPGRYMAKRLLSEWHLRSTRSGQMLHARWAQSYSPFSSFCQVSLSFFCHHRPFHFIDLLGFGFQFFRFLNTDLLEDMLKQLICIYNVIVTDSLKKDTNIQKNKTIDYQCFMGM